MNNNQYYYVLRKIICIIICLLLSLGVFGQTSNTLNKPKIKRVAEAYGLLLGQEYSLNLIKNKFPKFESEIRQVEYKFNSTFGRSKGKIIEYLENYLGSSGWEKFDNEIQTEVIKMFDNQNITDDIAKNFISEIDNRSKGNIPLGILETLLSFQFLDKPHEEFTTGFTYVFKTKGKPESKNTNWQITIPKSWKSNEGNRPNIVQLFQSDYGAGDQNIILMNKELPFPKGFLNNKDNLNNLFTEKEMKDFIPKENKFISFSKMTFDGIIGGMIIYEQIGNRLDFKFKTRMVQFMFIKDEKMYVVVGSVMSDNINSDLSIEMNKYLPLYKLVANSIIVNSQYK